jgi:type VI secretion system protein ImpB
MAKDPLGGRKPRVDIKYTVETGGAQVMKELPFVVGVLGDFSGNPTEPLKSLGDRNFTEITKQNFDDVLARMKPGLNLQVDNKLKDDGTQMSVQLKFEKMEDFDPVNVAKQVEPLRKLLEMRERLKDLKANAELHPELEKEYRELEQALKDEGKLGELQGQVVTPPEGE